MQKQHKFWKILRTFFVAGPRENFHNIDKCVVLLVNIVIMKDNSMDSSLVDNLKEWQKNSNLIKLYENPLTRHTDAINKNLI